MTLKKKLSSASRLYLILDKDACAGNDLKKILIQAIAGGIDIVQLRDKSSPTKDTIRLGAKLLEICRKAGIPLIINDRLDVALAIDADGLHVGQDDLPVRCARKILGRQKIIGISCHSIKDVIAAQKEKCDYLGFGPVFKTLTKPWAHATGIKALRKALLISKKPIFAIGGITEKKLGDFVGCKPLRIAVIREICLARNPKETAKRLKEKIRHV